MTQVSLESVHKSYGAGVQVIRGVDLRIGAGEFCVFLVRCPVNTWHK